MEAMMIEPREPAVESRRGLTRDEFEATVGRHYQTLVRAAVTAGAPEPEDAVQQALLELFEAKAYERFAPDQATVLTWLIKAVLNRVKRQFRRPPEVTLDEVPLVREETQEDVERRVDIERALAGLPQAQADAVRRVYLDEGLTDAEVSRAQNVPRGTVRWRLHKARQSLKGAF